jgi:hypothetical protein
MAGYSAWKTLERRHAKRMKGERLWRPDFGDSAPDGQNERDVWDTKAYARFSVVTLFLECEAKYKEWANGRRFHLCLFAREHPKGGDFILLRAKDYEYFLSCEERCAELNTAFLKARERGIVL